MKVVVNLGEIGSGSVIYPDKARMAFDGMMSVYEQLPCGVLDTLEMARFVPQESPDKQDFPYPFKLEVTLCRKLQGPNSTGWNIPVEKDFSVDAVKTAMLKAIKQLMDGLSYDAAQLQQSATQALEAFRSSTQV